MPQGARFIGDTLTDLRYAARSLARARGFVVTCAFTLATAIALCTLLATGVNGFFFRPLNVPGGARLVAIHTSDYSGPARRGASSYPDILDIARGAASLAEVAGEGRVMLGVAAGEAVVMVQGAVISPGYFTMLRVQPALGRYPGTSAGDVPAVVLSHTLWRRSFDADSSIIGRPVAINGHPFVVVAVASPAFRGTSREFANDFWIAGEFAPLVMPRDRFIEERGARRFRVLARLRDGIALDALGARLGAIAAEQYAIHPESWRDESGNGRRLTAVRERDAHLADIPRTQRLLVIGAVLAIGLGLMGIASANLASMQLARAAARRREFATRLALGAGRGRLIRQLLTESALVILPGATVGVLSAVVASRLLSHFRPVPLPTIDLGLDWRTLAFIAGTLTLVQLVFGLLPALQGLRTDLIADLKGGSRPGAGGVRVGRARGGMIVAQVALSVLLTAVSSLVAFALIRDARQGSTEAQNVLIARVNLLPAAGDAAAVGALVDQVTADLSALPGVERASVSDFVPTRGARRTVRAELRGPQGETARLELDANAVGPGYFGIVGQPMWRGRDFIRQDANDGSAVVIVTRAMAAALWPGEDALDKRLVIEARGATASAEVVGVVADRVGQGPATPQSFPGLLYLPWRATAEAELVLHVRAPAGQSAVAAEVARLLGAEDQRLVSQEVITLDRYYEQVVLPQRLLAYGAGGLAALQLLLAIAGLAGLVAYVTALRRRDVGILTALGASRRDVLRLVLRQGALLALGGGALGFALSLAVSPAIAATLPVTMPMLLSALSIGVGVFGVTAAVAMLLPAQRALGVPPADALRME